MSDSGTLDERDDADRRQEDDEPSTTEWGGAAGTGGSADGAPATKATGDSNSRIFVGNIKQPSSKEGMQKIFGEFGGIQRIDYKGHFAFIVFDESEAAHKAVAKYNNFDQGEGKVLKLEMAIDRPKADRRPAQSENGRQQTEMRAQRGPIQRFENRVEISSMSGSFPESLSWKDVKDWAKKTTGAQVTYTNVERDGARFNITVEFRTNDDAKAALTSLPTVPLEGVGVAVKPMELPEGYEPGTDGPDDGYDNWHGRDGGRGGRGGRGAGRGGRGGGRGGRGYYDGGGSRDFRGRDGYYDRDGGDYGRGGGDPYYRRDARERFNDPREFERPRDYPQDSYYGRGGGDPYYRDDHRDAGGYYDRGANYDRPPPPRDYAPDHYGRGGGGDPYYRDEPPRDRYYDRGGGSYDRPLPPRDAPMRERSRSRDRGAGGDYGAYPASAPRY